ncbi:hypothetical protein HXA34_02480 [Salipaludibacillus agaradhaerens]|uniref:hypothetical protein n=1 Tax=Salipaludibacillus agaradhaerens TaxID=76935 RepID=UPI0021511A64|nr:hypothetical protein [Salipaludibacillus agaradhaerens]MCR6105152.1 hypothetical protein [Salipaludibacillus agaradhaerens]MCR6117197.1 hypothetical protein [Salipaludibacillus agaradhaerens]UJW56392.1 hypothetical protein HXZ66_02635 [Bacillus sp. A116_S68]
MIRQLMSFELKHTPIRQYVLLCFLAAVFGVLAAQIVGHEFEGRKLVALDGLFLISGLAVQLCRYAPFSYQNRAGMINFHLLLRQTPLKIRHVVLSRMGTACFFVSCYYGIFLAVFYLFSREFRQTFETLFPLIGFAVVWISVGFFVASLWLTLEGGVTVKPYLVGLFGGLSFIPLLIIINLIYSWNGVGIAKGMTILASSLPLLTFAIVAGSLLTGYSLWNRRIAVSMRQVDYHV